MWIGTISLKNFKSYEQAKFEFPEPKDGKNLVIIGAKNAHGKTTLLEAIYLGLYGKDAFTHLGRAGLDEKTDYKGYLSKALHHNAPNERTGYQNEIGIEIFWRNQDNQKQGVRILRKWYFDRERKFIDEERRVTILKEGELSELLSDDEADDYLANNAMPLDYAPFFFFDGEKIVATAQTAGAGNWLQTALRGLLGVTLLGKLKKSLEDYRTQHIRAGSNANAQREIERLENELNQVNTKIGIITQRFNDIQEQHRLLNEEHERLLTTLGTAGSDSLITIKELTVQREALYQEDQQLMAQIYQSFENLPQALLPKESIARLMSTLKSEEIRLNHEASKEQVGDRVDDFWLKFSQNDKVRKAMGDLADYLLQKGEFKEAVRECWNDLWYPLPKDCASTIRHNYLSQTAHSYIKSEYQSLTNNMINQTLGDLIEKNEQVKSDYDQIIHTIDELEDTGKGELIERLKTLGKEKEESSALIGIRQNELHHSQKQYQALQEELDKKLQEMSENNSRQQKANRSDLVRKMIDELTSELLKIKVSEISQLATNINRTIFGEDRIAKIKIDENGAIDLYGKDGNKTIVDNSSGQTQVLVMSLIYAMAEATDYQMPCVIDTPLARLDSGRRANLLRHWTSLKQQVILLAQDAEIDGVIANEFSQFVNKTYLVKATSLNTGGALSNIQADSYFQ